MGDDRIPGIRVLILGAGRMGSQIGCEFVAAGHHVTWLARSEVRAERSIRRALGLLRRYGLCGDELERELLKRIAVQTRLKDVQTAPDLVLESVPEQLELKVDLLRSVAEEWPDAILASNTSSLSISTIAAEIRTPQRMIGLHYWNPPLLMPLVEVVVTPATDESVRKQCLAWLKELGKQPVVVERDVPGFIWNRLQFALLRESLWLVEQGVADPETVDKVVRDGLARRWRLTGPFETAELGGLETFARAAENIFPELSVALTASALSDWSPRPQSELDELAQRRDDGLAKEMGAGDSEGGTTSRSVKCDHEERHS